MASALYAVTVPPYGADTEFCNMYLAYETLSDRMKDMIWTLRGVNESGTQALVGQVREYAPT